MQSRFEDPTDAQGIIARGPEALQSQFSSGFGMVLNLLHTRSMDEARAFVQRSFNNYLGAWARVPQCRDADMLHAVSPHSIGRQVAGAGAGPERLQDTRQNMRQTGILPCTCHWSAACCGWGPLVPSC